MNKLILLCLWMTMATALNAQASTDYHADNNQRVAIKDEYILSFNSQSLVSNNFQFAKMINVPFMPIGALVAKDKFKVLMSRALPGGMGYKTNILMNRKAVGAQLWRFITGHPSFMKMQPNYEYIGEYREELQSAAEQAPNDPKYPEQFHHPVMRNTEAWLNLGPLERPVVVAVTDDGVDVDHEDLRDNIFVNSREIVGNGIDDDNNGYIDDITGWDFASGDNDPRPGLFYEHGTHVAGIIAATANNGIGVAGTAAPVAQIMPIRFYGGRFTSAIISESYKYAADNGADIITTSYNIDSFVGDEVFEDALAYVYQKGVIHFNSAGNSGRSGPRRKAFKELILVCSTIADGMQDDVISNFSNYGPGVDLCAPGGGGTEGILSTINNNAYDTKSGTSMAAPNAAAVAALIWAKNPNWNRDQVVAQLYGTAKNIDAENPSLIGSVGMGRADSLNALATDIKSVAVTTVSEVTRSRGNSGMFEVKVAFDNYLDPNTVIAQNFKVLDGNQEIPVQIAEPYKVGTNQIVLRFRHSGSVDTLIVKDFIQTPFGEAIDGNQDGLPGGDYLVNLRRGF